jgi:hypothetical protein
MSNVTKWMSWEGGIDLVAVTSPDLQMPNVIVHIARMVHTPLGSAPSGMLFWQPDVNAAPLVFGFVGADASVSTYFGPNIFAGTPFEAAPVLMGIIDIQINAGNAYAKCVTGNYTFEVELGEFSAPYLINRTPAAMPSFYQQGVEAKANKASLKINGQEIDITIPPVGISGGPAAVVSPNGVYAR